MTISGFRSVTMALALLAATVVAPVTFATPAAAATCNINGATSMPQAGRFIYEGVNIRSGPGTNCASLGLGYSSHSLTYRCWQSGDNVNGYATWTYLTDNTTAKTGWVNDQFLSNFGSGIHC